MIDISIVILSYNVRDFLLECLRSIYKHTGDLEFETIVVDNASDDDSVEKVREQFPQARVIVNSSNIGFSCGNNVGLMVSRGRAVIILNCDTEIRGNVFKELYDALFSDPKLGAVGPRLVYPNGRIQHFCAQREPNIWQTLRRYYLPYFTEPKLYLKEAMRFPGLFETEGLSGAAMMVKREVLEKVGGLDEGFWAYCEDTDWSRRILLSGFRLACLTTVEVLHHHGKSSCQNDRRRRVEAIKSEIRYFHKHGGIIERSIYRIGIVLNLLLCIMSIDLFRFVAGRRERLAIDRAMLHCSLFYKVSDVEAFTREPIREARIKEKAALTP